MNAPTLIIKYSIEFEQLRVKTTFEKISWYREHGYKPSFPAGKGIDDIQNNTTAEELIACAISEYDENYYVDVSTKISEQWKWFSERWSESPIHETNLPFLNKYKIFVTSYGVTGSYDLPNTIVINVRKRDHERLGVIIFHEMIHLSIEAFVQKYNIPHWYKERLVDLYFKYFFPNKSFEQNLSAEVLTIDPLFVKNRNDIGILFLNIAKKLKLQE